MKSNDLCYIWEVMLQNHPYPSTKEYLEHLVSRGIYHFTTEEFAKARGSNLVSARAAIRRAGKNAAVVMPYRGFLLIVPPEYRALGCLPADQFVPQLMAHLNESYYVGLLSAAVYYGAAHQAPQKFQVITIKNRKSIRCGKVNLEFFAKKNLQSTPTKIFNTSRGTLSVSTPEATAFDLLGYYQHCGGLDNVATVLHELAEKVSTQKLAEAAMGVPMPWVQRLGYLLTVLGFAAKARGLIALIEKLSPPMIPLLPGVTMRGSVKNRLFNVAINVDVEPDL